MASSGRASEHQVENGDNILKTESVYQIEVMTAKNESSLMKDLLQELLHDTESLNEMFFEY